MSKRRRRRSRRNSVSIYGAIILIIVGLVGTLSKQGNPTAQKITNEVTQVVGKSQQSTGKTTTATTPKQSVATQALAKAKYTGTQIVAVNHNHPTFSQADLSVKKGSWQRYGQLDGLNRVTTANALLGKDLMPTDRKSVV